MPNDNRKEHLVVLVLANILAWVSFFSVLFFTNPGGAGFFGAMILCLSFVLGIASLFILIWQLKTKGKN
jgi:hypothetical protein